MSNHGPLATAIWVAVVGAVAAAITTASISALPKIGIEVFDFVGLTSKKSFAPYETCSKKQKLYIPGHAIADKDNCVEYTRGLTLEKTEDEFPISGNTHHTFVEPTRSSLLVVTANATAETLGNSDPTFMVITIRVSNKECASSEEVLSGKAAESFVMRVTTVCVVALPAGKHELFIKRTVFGVDTSALKAKLTYRYQLISQ